jgi:hypothetical protein
MGDPAGWCVQSARIGVTNDSHGIIDVWSYGYEPAGTACALALLVTPRHFVWYCRHLTWMFDRHLTWMFDSQRKRDRLMVLTAYDC